MGGRSHQTVRIARGRHKSPADGACVMELASMLAGERFTDKPRCVDPVVSSYLRTLNDLLPPRERQRLYPYAAAAVGTRAGRRVSRARRELCLRSDGPPRPLARPVIAALIGIRPAVAISRGAGEWAARRAIARHDVEGAFRLLDDLISLGRSSEPPALALPVEDLPQLRVTGPAAPLVLDT
jgi:hypothetical protein